MIAKSVQGDSLVAAARELLALGRDAFSSPQTAEFVADVRREHPAAALYEAATARAIAGRDLERIDPAEAASEVFDNFVWTHFVCKLVMTANPAAAVEYARERFDTSAIASAVEAGGAAILSAFHYTGYPLVALELAVSPVDLLVSKARVDVIEKSASNVSDHVVYLSDRSAAIRLARALRRGRSVWVMLDVVLPGVRVVRADFLGRAMNVGAGLGRIARTGGRPCLPVFWRGAGAARVQTGRPIAAGEREDGDVIQEFVDTQAAFVREHPTEWLEWYSVLDDAAVLRKQVKAGNDRVWARIAQAMG